MFFSFWVFSDLLSNRIIYTDIYVAMVSSTHNVCAKDIYIAIVSTIVETDNPEMEIAPGLQLLGSIYDKFSSHSFSRIFHGVNILAL